MNELPRFKELREQIEGMKAVLNLASVFAINKKDICADRAKLEAMEKQLEEMGFTLDAFNDLFSKRGWIIFDNINLDMAKAVVNKAKANNIDEAEIVLVEHYSAETVEWHLRTMWEVKAFQSRMPLAEKAYEDYKAERYHACVPVILALMDGMVSEVHYRRGVKQRGFFAEDVDLTAWDSIAGHNKGLNSLVKIFRTTRFRTVSGTISIPYRNGILHGMDLGYDNKTVAAKTWAALFALREWAVQAEKNLLQEQPKIPQPSWKEILATLAETEKFKEQIKAWVPRQIEVGVDIPSQGIIDDYAEGSPERKLVEVLSYCKSRNYGHMARNVGMRFREESENKTASQLKEIYKGRKFEKFELQDIEDEAAAITTIRVKIWEPNVGSYYG